jgi:hypothetical protein
LGLGDFNQDGKLDLVAMQGVLLQTTVQLSSEFGESIGNQFAVKFGNQNVCRVAGAAASM